MSEIVRTKSNKETSIQETKNAGGVNDQLYTNSLKRLPAQCKLTIGAVNDPLEAEADAMADRVVNNATPTMEVSNNTSSSNPISNSLSRGSLINRKCAECEEEDKLQRKPKHSYLQLKSGKSTSVQATDAIAGKIDSASGRGQKMGDSSRQFMESNFGADFSQVKIHTGSYASELSHELGAHAFTVGNDIFFNNGKYSPDTKDGKHLLAHELTHTIQQNGSAMLVQRQLARPNTVDVQHAGITYRVSRTRQFSTRREAIPPQVSGGLDRDNVYINVAWCQDAVRGNVRLGANIPEAARDVAGQVLNTITSGGGGNDITRILQTAEATPFIEMVIAQSGEFRLTTRGEISISSEGVMGGGGSISLQRGEFDVSVSGQGDDNGGSITGNVRWTPGRRQQSFTCPTRLRGNITTQYRCEQLTPGHDEERTRMVPGIDRRVLYLYFNYARDVIDEVRSNTNLNEIQRLLMDGYSVNLVEGFTSPEGRKERRRGGRFMGNRLLADARAAKAIERLQTICQAILTAGTGSCVMDPAVSTTPLGQGELYSLSDDTIEGDPLAAHATSEFLTQAEEEVHRDEVMTQQLQQLTPDQQADIVYPLLRRAAIVLTKPVDRPESYQVRVPDSYTEVTCPQEVLTAARSRFTP